MGGGSRSPLSLCWPHVGRGGAGEREGSKGDLFYILPQLKGTLYKFRIEQFGDIHCKITIKAMEG